MQYDVRSWHRVAMKNLGLYLLTLVTSHNTFLVASRNDALCLIRKQRQFLCFHLCTYSCFFYNQRLKISEYFLLFTICHNSHSQLIFLKKRICLHFSFVEKTRIGKIALNSPIYAYGWIWGSPQIMVRVYSTAAYSLFGNSP